MVLIGVCHPEAGAKDAPTAEEIAARPAPPEVGSPPKEEEPGGGLLSVAERTKLSLVKTGLFSELGSTLGFSFFCIAQ